MKKIHLICNAHIDPVWQWGWDEGISSALSTYKSACDLLEVYDFKFCHNESMLYEMIEKVDPSLFKKIQRFIKEKKWVVIGGCYLQPDCNMPNGETMIRLIQTGQKYFKDKFGVIPTINCNFDSFGHSLGLVQIMSKCGFKGYLICRPNQSQFNYPGKFFNWVGPDGSNIVVSQSSSYLSLLGEAKNKILDTIYGKNVSMLGSENKQLKTKCNDVDYVLWGVGNHGGGPSKKDLEDIKQLKINGVDIIHSTPEDLFNDDIEISGEVHSSLITCMPGCYSSMARIKLLYRKVENLYYQVEKMASLCSLGGMDINFSKLDEAIKHLFLATFHDILPGTVIREGEQEGLSSLYAAERILKDLRTEMFMKLINGFEPMAPGEYPLFVFNYGDKKEKKTIEFEFSLDNQNWNPDFIYYPDVYINQQSVPSQLIKEESTLNLDWRKKVVFTYELDPLSITRFSVKVRKGPRVDKFHNPKPTNIKENVLHYPELVMFDDTADPWGMSEKELKVFGTNKRVFKLMSDSRIKRFTRTNSSLTAEHIIEDGNILTCYEGLYHLCNTNGVIQSTIYKHDKYQDVKVIVEFNEKNKLIRLRIPIPEEFLGGELVGDGPYIVEEKIKASHSVFNKWLGIKKNNKYFAVINDGVYAGTCDGKYLYITLLRGSGYCFHPIPNKKLYPEDRYLPRIDCGSYEFSFRIMNGDLFNVARQAENFNSKPYATNVFPGGGQRYITPKINIDGNVLLTSIKKIESGFAFRIYNPNLTQEKFSLSTMNLIISGELKRNEIATIVFDKDLKIVKDKFL